MMIDEILTMENIKMNAISEQPKPGNGRTMTVVWFMIGVISLAMTACIGINDNLPGILLFLCDLSG